MGLFKVTTAKEAVQENKGASYISKSGIYDVVIKFANLDTAKSGAERVNFNIEWNGNTQAIYGPWVQSKAGEPIESGLKLINRLLIIAGLGHGDEPTIETETHNVGKDNKPMDFQVITNFTDLECKIRLQEVYSLYEGEIRKAMVPRGFYAANGASAEEILNGGEAGTQLAKDEAYASKVTYEDGVTPEDVEAWKAAKASGENAPKVTPTAPAATAGKPKSGLFK
jgi:hypothetical protein